MKKPGSKSVPNQEPEFDIIELAIDDLETLTKAFELIEQVVLEGRNTALNFKSDIPDTVIN